MINWENCGVNRMPAVITRSLTDFFAYDWTSLTSPDLTLHRTLIGGSEFCWGHFHWHFSCQCKAAFAWRIFQSFFSAPKLRNTISAQMSVKQNSCTDWLVIILSISQSWTSRCKAFSYFSNRGLLQTSNEIINTAFSRYVVLKFLIGNHNLESSNLLLDCRTSHQGKLSVPRTTQ